MSKNKTHKFIILHVDQDESFDVVRHGQDLLDRICHTWDDRIRVVECRHPVFEDNCVDLFDENGNDTSFVQDIKGNLYYWTDVMTKFEIIEAFE
jgi:hypothetical protein